MNMLSRLLKLFRKKEEKPAWGPDLNQGLQQVTTDASRCCQCGICGHNCPVGIEVREYARRGENVTDSRCISCGACIEECPRGSLNWGPAVLIRADHSLEIGADSLPIHLELQPRRPL
jgi:ferredoxin